MENCTAEYNGGAGIRVENMNLVGRKITLRGNEQGGLIARNSHVDIEDMDVS